MSEIDYHVPNLERALQIIQALSENPKGMTQKDLIDWLKVSKNSIYRITMTLIAYGIVARDDVTRRYYLTRKLMVLGASAMGDQNLVDKSIENMRSLRDEVNASVFIGVIEGTQGVILEQAIGGHPFKYSVDLGSRFPLHCSAPGKAIMAFMLEDKSEELLKQLELTVYNSRTLSTQDALRNEFKQIRSQGFAVDLAEQFEGCHCVGAPILDHQNQPIAAIWASGPSLTLPEEKFSEIGKKVKECADRISVKFGKGLMKS